MWYPCNGADFVGKKTVHVDLNNSANQKIREPTCHFSGKVKHENFISESIVPNIVESFSDVKECSHYMFFLLKLSITDWESLKR